MSTEPVSTELRVTRIEVRNVLGAVDLKLKPGGKYTILAGRNGSGKSTALAAVQAALGGGNLAKLAHIPSVAEAAALAAAGQDAAAPEVVLVLDGPGNERYEVRRKADKVKVLARVGDTAAFEERPQPQTWLRQLYDPDGANPVAFLNAKDTDRARMLLEALPLAYNRFELLVAMGVVVAELPAIPANLHPLEEIGLIRDGIFRTRTGVNRERVSKDQAAEQVLRSAPAVVPNDPGADAEQEADAEVLELGQQHARAVQASAAAEGAAILAARTEYERRATEVTTAFKREAATLRSEHDVKAAEIRAEAESRIADRAAKMEALIEERRTADEALIDAAEATRDAATGEAQRTANQAATSHDALREALEAAKLRRAGIAAERDRAAGARALHDQAKRFSDEAAKHKVEADRLTAALTALDEFSRRLASDLPIEGLEILGKEIRVNGILFEQLNQAQRVDIAVRVACLRAKEQRLPIVFVDGAETLDDDAFALLVARLEAAGVQSFIGRVETHDLEERTDEEVRA